MEHGARLSTSRVMAIAFIFMSVLIVLSLSVNVIQGVNNYRLQNEQRTAVTPMAFNAPFIAVNSLDGALTNNEQTASGGVVVATVNKKPFTFILETERGLNLSIQAVPREGAGRTIQLVSDLRGTGEEAGAWETSTPYESLLVTISQAVRGGKLPAGWYQVPVTKETLQAPAGLSSVADAVWTGNHLKMVRFAVENKTLSALNIRESDFWQPGTRAVMFSQPASQLLAGARMDVYVIRDGEGN
ncbi:TPA: type-F conjugative transfer system secretin TraK [Escherichia coli]|uniref:type-F conjugative transfer system secretin TraK n=1 Tax=Escherichia coli TaxID=562 RepID=UPI00083CF80F|nr:type-F conjugative transfer system secretin TraK [Escherichia coli]EFK2836535.1 type-F conjugative transfer system secretin TraK [Escherichia coli]EJI8352761.1 type-F conjugative transfer system secretin TraK [Escherichia coli]EKZ9137029.1 type-F conjugative transfer system secretin TraK [Escherichia coli]ELB8923250.1 type-F conjugative transfer system secretin TraK [Escherichia coli]ELN1577106.1 type-F conjugative transfer system secretin TraK [Escherichia coli]